MVSVSFLLQDSQGRAWFFEETFLLINTSIKVVLEIFFLPFTNSNWEFDTKKLTWRSYIVAEALLTAKKVELINKYEFVKSELTKNSNTFIVYVATLEAPQSAMLMHFLRPLLLAVL